ncbi:MAG TPA: hypothetical protein VIF62_19610 [Labilithrix sp.]
MKRALVILVALAACEEKKPVLHEAPPNASGVAETLGIDASTFADGVDPPAPAGDLRAEIDRFTTIEACVTERAKVDPLVGDAIRGIGYDTFFRDACRLLEAAKDKKTETCERIDSSALRKQCKSWVAMIAQTPDECPLDLDGVPPRGRTPLCVAVAGKDPRMCAAEGRSAMRATCDALVQRDEKKCDSLLPADRASCRRELARWRSLLAAPLEGLPKLPEPRGKLVLHGADGTMDPPTPETALAPDLARGAVVVTGARDRARVELGAIGELDTLHVVGSPNRRVRVGVSVLVDRALGSSGDAKPTLERFELEIPGEPPLAPPNAKCECKLTQSRVDKQRGGEVSVALEGTIRSGSRAYAVQLEAATFVRDVVAETAGGPRILPAAHPALFGTLDAGR